MTRKMFIRSVGVVLVLAWSAAAGPGQPEPVKPLDLPKPPVVISKPALVRPSDNAEPPLAATMNPVWITTKQFRIKHEIKGSGPSGVKAIGLWWTRDGREWMQQSFVAATDAITFRVSDDGLYGFSLVVQKGDGRIGAVPRLGDTPQIWVCVDSTPPSVVVHQCEIGEGTEIGKVTIRWDASDKNFAEKPISLYYARQSEGPWKPIAENIASSGTWSWQVPVDILPNVYIRCKAVDKAGNVTEVTTREPVIIDFSKPEAVILGVEPIADKQP
jgi:hypothetical protein